MSTIPPKPRTTTAERLRAVPDDETRIEEQAPRVYKPIAAPDVDDLALLPQHVRLLANEVRDLVDVVRGTIAPALRRIEERQRESDVYAMQLARGIHDRIDALQAALTGAK